MVRFRLWGYVGQHEYTPNDESRNLTSNIIASFNYRLSRKISTSFSTGLNKSHRGEQKLYLINSSGSLSAPLYRYRNLARLSGDIRLYLPTHKPSYKGQSLRSRFSLSPRLGIDLSQLDGVVRLKHTYLSLKSVYTHNFYRFKTSYRGSPNTRHSIQNTLGVSYTGIKGLLLSASFGNIHSWSTLGKRKPDAFGMSQEVSYQVIPSSSLSLGHSIGGSTFKDDGVTSNIEFFHPNKSYVYTSWTYRF